MNLIQVQNGSKQFGTKLLFDKATFAVNESEHVGVIGPNGAGKTTLFKILIGEETLDEGQLIQSQKLRIGYLKQEAQEPSGISCEDYLQENCSKPLWELKQLGLDLGLKEEHFQGEFSGLSGGYRMRMKLLVLIGHEPNLMLLDEPTNFLDLESLLALESYLQSYEGAFLLISHDREFLRRTTDHTLEVEAGDIVKYPGNIDDYFEEKQQLQKILEAQIVNQEAKKKQVMDFVSKFGAKASKAKQAQSRLKSLEKMETIEIKDVPVRARIKIPPPVHTGKEVLQLNSAKLGYGSKVIVQDCDLRLMAGQHLGVVGFNGQGKSTLLKSLAGRIPLIDGKRNLGYGVEISYYAQHVSEDLDLESTIWQCLYPFVSSEVPEQMVLNLAGSLLFAKEALQKKIKVLSGGEKSRVALAQILLQRRPLLLLDEPTNHLDFDTVEALTEALRDFAGTVVVVSHDRSFIGRIANRILEIRDGQASMYPGTYDEYLWSLQRGSWGGQTSPSVKAPSKNTKEVKAQSPVKNEPEIFVNTRHIQAQVTDLKRKMQKTEEKLQKKSEALIQANEKLQSLYGGTTGSASLNEVLIQVQSLQAEVHEFENQILESMEQIESLEGTLNKIQ